MWVRLPPLELTGRASRSATAPRSKRDEAQALEGSTPSPSALVSLAERPRHRAPNPIRRVRLPQDTLGDRLTVGQRALNPRMKVRVLLPEPHATSRVRMMKTDSGVVEWLQRLALNEERSVRFRPPVLAVAQVRQRHERLGLNPSACGFKSHPGYSVYALVEQSGVLVTLSR